MGNPKKPTALKILQGTRDKSREPKNEPKPMIRIPNPPKFLSIPAKEEWERISKELYTLGLLSEMDRSALSLYCQAWGRIVEFEGMIAAETDQDEMFKIIKMLDKTYTHARLFLTEFGMSPASRSKISVKKSDGKKNPFADF